MLLDVTFSQNEKKLNATFDGVQNISDGGYERGLAEGYANGKAEGLTEGKAEGQEIGYADALAKRTDLVATENGEYTPSEDSTGFKRVSVNVQAKSKLVEIYNKTVTKITIDDLQGATRIGKYAFEECMRLVSIDIPSTVAKIDNYAFYDCRNLGSLFLPNALNSIGQYAFQYCGLLENISIPESVTTIGMGCFQFCKKLKSFVFPNAVTTIDAFIFQGCEALESVEIGNNVRYMYNIIFGNKCTSLKSIKIKTRKPPSIQSQTFQGLPTDCVITVDYGCGEEYKSATNWSVIADQIVEGDV